MPEVSPFAARSAALPDRSSFERSLRRGTKSFVLALAAPTLLLLAMVGYLVWSAAQVDRSRRVVSHAHAVEKLLIDMETGLRGFNLTRERAFLEPYLAAEASVGPELDAVSRLVQDDPVRTADVAGLRDAVATWRSYAASLLRSAGEAGPADAGSHLRGKTLMDDVRSHTSAIVAREDRLAESRALSLPWIVNAILTVLGLGFLIAIPLLTKRFRRGLRKLAANYEEGLRAAELRAEELRITLGSIGDAVLSTDAAGVVIYLNREAERLTGWSSAEAQGRSMAEVFPIFSETTGLPAVEPVARVLRERAVVGLANHTVLRRRDGLEIPIEDSAAPIFDAAGNIRGVILVFHDVSASRADELRLREHSRLATLRAEVGAHLATGETNLQVVCELVVQHLDAAFARVWTLDGPGTTLLLHASAGLYTHLDGPHARVPVGQFKIGRIAASRQPHLTNDVPHDPNISNPEWAAREGMRAFAGYPLIGEGRLVGVLALFSRRELSEAVLTDLAPLCATIARSVERREAETELHAAQAQAEAALRAAAEGAERFRLLAETVSLQVWTARPDGALDWVNPYVISFFGARSVEQEVLGSAWAQKVHPTDLPPVAERWARSIQSGTRYEAEFRLLRGDGEYRWFLVRAEAMRDASGAIVRWFGTNTEVHDLKVAQQAAVSAARAKDDFLAALSHELRTPLTPVLMTAAALREDERLPADAREQLRMMERNIALEARLIDDLLDLTRIANGKLSLRLQPCDAHSLINLAMEIVRDDAQVKAIALERAFTAEQSGLVADPARFQQVIWNLLRNAVKFTPRGGRVAIRTLDRIGATGEPELCVEVEDSGIGMAPEVLDKIFLPFDQGHIGGDHRFGGLGLGLSIARAIVELHGGAIHAQSEGTDRGATFHVQFPGAIPPPQGAHDPIAPLLPGLEPATPPAPSESARPSLHLLLVEDHEATITVLARLLTRAGHRVQTARNITDALALAGGETFDAVISDLGLPDGTGTELMEQLRDRYGLRGIALSGYGMEDDLARSREAGFITHLVKPVDFTQLDQALREFANRPAA